MQIRVHCTDCGHERVLDDIDTNVLPLDILMLNTHSCYCTKKCEDCEDISKCEECEDMQIYKKTTAALRQEVAKLKLQLKGVHIDVKHQQVFEARPIWARPYTYV